MRSLVCLALVTALGCSRAEPPRPAPAVESPALAEEPEQPVTIDKGDGLKVEILVRGGGAEVASTSEVALHYEAFVAGRETPFDSTRASGAPLRVDLDASSGDGRVIEGLARGLVGLREGAHARISIPPALAWGAGGNDSAGVPADAELVYDVRVVGVE